jgi:SAM-dependent methyltransferase
MDQATLKVYDADPQTFVERWRKPAAANDVHALIVRYFRRGLTADIGSGSGRDTAWLHANGFPVIGFDASAGLLAQARALYPQITFEHAVLPDLHGVAEHRFDNVLCRAVIMHLPRDEIAPAVKRMVSLLKPGGVLLLNWRTTKGADQRDEYGRLYSAFDSAVVRDALSGQTILFEEEGAGRVSNKFYHSLIAQAS